MITAWVDNKHDFERLIRELVEAGFKFSPIGPEEEGEFHVEVKGQNGGKFAVVTWKEGEQVRKHSAGPN